MSIANSQTARAAERRGADNDDWAELLFGPDPVAETSEANRPLTPPLLARVPDVTDVPRPTFRASRSLPEPGAVRVDPPAPRGPVGRHNEADRARLCDVAVTLRHADKARDARPRQLPAKLDVFPASNPFEIPGERLHEKFAPVVRFLLLFVLFTAAGTSVLMIGKSPETSSIKHPKHPVATVERAVGVPTANQAAVTRPTLESLMQQAQTKPTRPTVEAAPAVARTDTKLTPYIEPQEPPADDEAVIQNPTADEMNTLPYPTTDYQPPKLPSAADGPFPQVRTTDPRPALALKQGATKVSPR